MRYQNKYSPNLRKISYFSIVNIILLNNKFDVNYINKEYKNIKKRLLKNIGSTINFIKLVENIYEL